MLGMTGPGYGLNVLGVDNNCAQAIIEVYSPEIAEAGNPPQRYYIAPEKFEKPVLIDKPTRRFVDFVDNHPVFLDHTQNKLYLFSNEDFVPFSDHAIPFTFSELGLHINPATKQLYYGQSWSNSDPDYVDPATGSQPAEGFSQIVRFDLMSGQVKTLSSKKGFADVQGLSASPDFNLIVYAQFSQLDLNGARKFELSVYDSRSESTQELSQKSVQWADVWLSNEEFLGVESRLNSDSTYTTFLWKCNAVSNSCSRFISDAASVHVATQ